MTDEPHVARTVEELQALIEQDERADATKLSPREYAKLRGMSPQLVYYHLRNHGDEIQLEVCVCGRPVVDIKLMDEYFKHGEYEEGANDV